jgi:tetratricopeptide (TPR) repeat protein
MSSHPCASGRHAVTAAAVAVLLAGCAAPAPEAMTWRLAPNYRLSSTEASAAQGYTALARQYEGERRWREARDAWRKAALAAPQDADIQNELGMAEASQGLYGNAVTALQRAVALAPERAALLNNLGYALLLDGRSDEAKSVLQAALARNPEHPLARANLGRIDQLAVAVAPVVTPAQTTATLTTPTKEPEKTQTAVLAMESPPSMTASSPPATAAARLQTAPNLVPLQVRNTYSQPADPGETLVPVAAAAAAPPPIPSAEALLPAAEAPQPAARVQPVQSQPVTLSAWQAAKPRVEIANGNGVTGMAARLGGWMSAHGMAQNTRLSNALPFNTVTTVVHYRVGYFAAAQELAARLPNRATLAAAPGGALKADVRVVLGHDLRAIRTTAFSLPPQSPAPTEAIALAAAN